MVCLGGWPRLTVGPRTISCRECATLRDLPALAAQRVHQLDGALDERGRLVDFLNQFGAIGLSDHDAIVPIGTVPTDFVAELFAVAVEKPNHEVTQRTSTM